MLSPPSGCLEQILAAAEPIVPTRSVRSTVLLASVNNIKDSEYFEEYAKRLGRPRMELLAESIVGTWLPMELALAHYTTCDQLAIPVDRAIAMGRSTMDKIGPTLVGTALRMLKQAGATPWSVVAHFERFWSRAYLGSGVNVYKVGPKDAWIDVLGQPLCASSFYRSALRGLVGGLVMPFCTKMYLHERPGRAGQNASVVLRLQWA